MTILAEPTSTAESAPATRSAVSAPAPSATGSDAAAHAGVHLLRDASSPTEDLLRARARLPMGDPERGPLRTRAIENNLPLAYLLTRRYAGSGEGVDDLRQVAALALVKAVDGYDPDRSTPFISYAIPTIMGALKRHFRDTTWGMRVPRPTQELLLSLPAASSHLTHLRGRPPTSAELAEHLRVDVAVLLAAVTAAQVHRLPSLNQAVAGHDTTELIDLIGAVDPRYIAVDDHLALSSLVAALLPRERRILTMRFCDEMTQERIAAEIGISQMQVSRLLRRALARLRVEILAAADDPAVKERPDPRR